VGEAPGQEFQTNLLIARFIFTNPRQMPTLVHGLAVLVSWFTFALKQIDEEGTCTQSQTAMC
jgi:hypothetical protein